MKKPNDYSRYKPRPYNEICPESTLKPSEITRDAWLKDAFPEWGRFLNYEIDHYTVPKGEVSMWWVGGSSWVLKTDEGSIFLIDPYAGVSHSTKYGECGVCYQSGAEFINWLKLTPQYLDPWAYERIDGYFISHTHCDHCDPYAVAAAKQVSDTSFYGPKVVTEKLVGEFGVPKERVVTASVGQVLSFPGAKVHILPNYDDTAIRTDTADALLAYDDCCLSFLFETSGGNILFAGDTWYNDAYVEIGATYDIDVATFDMGYNAVGATDKMTPFDALRFGQALRVKVLIPDHYDIWANIAGEPNLIIDQFERIVAEMDPGIRTVVMRGGGRFDYPADQDIKRYWYPDGSESYNFDKSAIRDAIAKRRPVLTDHKSKKKG
ncbi:MAG: ascorbate 6-phosphate lactonase [Clostridiales bacterium]|nr:ascorbate 6-phosphate lactonase [Clostridiales bacterium]